MKEIQHEVDFCVIGGGMAGLCAALAAARHGASVLLMQDRPVLGGNASSEIRMHICGAARHDVDNMRETGILEEIELDNRRYNPDCSFYMWDMVLFTIAKQQKNMELLLNCTCTEAGMDGSRIEWVKGWQLTTETWHVVKARYFADCSGDSILAPLTGAAFRLGREGSGEFGESIEPQQADTMTMSMSCLMQLREHDTPQSFIRPPWAYNLGENSDFEWSRLHTIDTYHNFWWIELGGDRDTIHDTEQLRDELLKIIFGLWDHMKNDGDHGFANWSMEWFGMLPGKRESRRYVGDYILTQNDVEAEGRFDDIVAYGGWKMDDHHPGGFYYAGVPSILYPAPNPYGIPYRCLYSANIENLFFAGRNISATHAAFSSTRVMGTCSVIGQAVGTAAAIAVREDCSPRAVYLSHIRELQNTLMDDDCWLPWLRRPMPELTRKAVLKAAGVPDTLLNGVDRPTGGEDNGWTGRIGDSLTFEWPGKVEIESVRLVFDSHLSRREKNMPHFWPKEGWHLPSPETLVRGFVIEVRDANGWKTCAKVEDNHQRLVRLSVHARGDALRLTPTSTWGAETVHIFGFDVR